VCNVRQVLLLVAQQVVPVVQQVVPVVQQVAQQVAVAAEELQEELQEQPVVEHSDLAARRRGGEAASLRRRVRLALHWCS
jgi:hypothetical protein